MEAQDSGLTALAARVVTGLSPGNGASFDVRELLVYLEANKYPLLALDHDSGWPDLHNSAEFNVAQKEHRRMLTSLRSEYLSVRDRWAEAGIPCILIKAGGLLPSFPYTSDNLDVLVWEERADAAAQALRELGYVELRNIEEPHKFLFRKFRGRQCVSAIHLHTWVGWNVGFLDEGPLWQNSRLASDDQAVRIPSPDDVILITVAHSFYENKCFRLADLVRIKECWRSRAVDWDYLNKAARQRGWSDGLHFSLLVCAHLEETLWGQTSIPERVLSDCKDSLARWPIPYHYYRQVTRHSPASLPFRISFLFSKLLYYRKILRDRNDTLPDRLLNVIRTLAWGIKLRLRIRPQPSFLVSFSGPDGSGKTLHACTLAESLRVCDLRTRYHWSRIGASGLVRSLGATAKALLGDRVRQGKRQRGASGRMARLRSPILRFAWSWLTAVDMMLFYLFRVRLSLLRGNIVICDRYAFDAAAEMEASLPPGDKLNRLAIRAMLASAPKPAVAYLLDLPEEVCMERKEENTPLDYLRRQRRAYASLARHYGLLTVRTDADFDANASDIVREVLTAYYSGYDHWLNRLFLANFDQLNPGRLLGAE